MCGTWYHSYQLTDYSTTLLLFLKIPSHCTEIVQHLITQYISQLSVGSSMTHSTITLTVAVHWLVGKKGISNSVVALLLFHSYSHTWQQCFENFSTIIGYQFLPQLWYKAWLSGVLTWEHNSEVLKLIIPNMMVTNVYFFNKTF